MLKKIAFSACFLLIICCSISFKDDLTESSYALHYRRQLEIFNVSQNKLLSFIEITGKEISGRKEEIKKQVNLARLDLKRVDFWLRYLGPVSYKQINGPLPVEWETEVFEKFEKPYKRVGAGLTLAYLYLDEETVDRDSLLRLIRSSIKATSVFYQDSIKNQLLEHDHFFLCNRLFLLNLAAIYSTGFECANTEQIIPELEFMLENVSTLYSIYNQSFPSHQVSPAYLTRFNQLLAFVKSQPKNHETFDHFTFIKNHVNPLFAENQALIEKYDVGSKSYLDYSLNKNAKSIFSKALYRGQNAKGIYVRVYDQKVLAEIENIGKLLFFDPILSGNNMRSCASCHKPGEAFTDTLRQSALHFNGKNNLPRSTPSLLNVGYNHLLMADGKHFSLQDQARAVISNPSEMACKENEILEKILSCSDYKKAFTRFLQYTPTEKEITVEHISSAITLYYNKFSGTYSPFDQAMNSGRDLNASEKAGFNLFMSKAQCATCHFVPQFNGVKPPYIGSEFEVLGVPKDTLYTALSDDVGRYNINPAEETHRAFRTGTIRNAAKTKPYMHNGVFTTLDQVIEFYNCGGGKGKGLSINNQTLSADSLHLDNIDKANLIAFIKSLNEDVQTESPPKTLPLSKNKKLNTRKVGGEY